jgi:hypothetical protein
MQKIDGLLPKPKGVSITEKQLDHWLKISLNFSSFSEYVRYLIEYDIKHDIANTSKKPIVHID